MLYDVNIDFGTVNFPKPYQDRNTVYIGFTSIFSGCNRALSGKACPNCQNSFLWFHDMTAHGKITSAKDAYIFTKRKMDKFTGLYSDRKIQYYYTILGGEPLDQPVSHLEEVQQSIYNAIKDSNPMIDTINDVPTVMFSGYDNLRKVSSKMKNYIINNVTYLKIGRYLGNRHKKDNLPSGLATENQKWIKVADSNFLTKL